MLECTGTAHQGDRIDVGDKAVREDGGEAEGGELVPSELLALRAAITANGTCRHTEAQKRRSVRRRSCAASVARCRRALAVARRCPSALCRWHRRYHCQCCCCSPRRIASESCTLSLVGLRSGVPAPLLPLPFACLSREPGTGFPAYMLGYCSSGDALLYVNLFLL